MERRSSSPKAAWKSISRAGTQMIRKLSIDGSNRASRDASRAASRKASDESANLPRSESPTQMLEDAQAQVNSLVGQVGPIVPNHPNIMPITVQGDGAVDLSSPVSASGPPVVVDIVQKQASKAAGTPAAEAQQAGYVVDLANPDVAPQDPAKPQLAAQVISAVPQQYAFPLTPPASKEATEELHEHEHGEPESHIEIELHSGVLPAMEEDPGITISSGPVDPDPKPINLQARFQSKAPVAENEPSPYPPQDLDSDQPTTIVAETIHISQPVHSVEPISEDVDEADDPFGPNPVIVTSVDPFADSHTRLLPPRSAGLDSQYTRPYTIPSMNPLSSVSQVQVQVDEETNGLLTHSAGRLDSEWHKTHIAQWTSYTLPTGAQYFYHVESRVVTDVDLSKPANLHRVKDYIEQAVHEHRKKRLHTEIDRLIDDSVDPTGDASEGWPTDAQKRLTCGYGATGTSYAVTSTTEDRVGFEMWLRSHGARGEFAPLTMWVDHMRKTVSATAPWESDSNEAEDPLDTQLRYWEFLESHPTHTGLPAGTAEEALEALSWCYTDLLLHPYDPKDTHPFTLEECRELLNLVKTLEAQSIGALQTHVIAKIQVRLVKHRQARTRGSHEEHKALLVVHHKNLADPFGNPLTKMFMIFFCFGIPFKYVPKESERGAGHAYGQSKDKPAHGALLADSAVFSATLTVVATMLITSAVIFLTLPGLANAARLAILISLLFSTSSLVASVINVQRRALSSQVSKHDALHGAWRHPEHPFIQSLPLVFIAYSVIALITASYLYIYHVTAYPDNGEGEVLNDALKWAVVGVGSGLGLVLLFAAWLRRQKA